MTPSTLPARVRVAPRTNSTLALARESRVRVPARVALAGLGMPRPTGAVDGRCIIVIIIMIITITSYYYYRISRLSAINN